jgi:hypothetical protein
LVSPIEDVWAATLLKAVDLAACPSPQAKSARLKITLGTSIIFHREKRPKLWFNSIDGCQTRCHQFDPVSRHKCPMDTNVLPKKVLYVQTKPENPGFVFEIMNMCVHTKKCLRLNTLRCCNNQIILRPLLYCNVTLVGRNQGLTLTGTKSATLNSREGDSLHKGPH